MKQAQATRSSGASMTRVAQASLPAMKRQAGMSNHTRLRVGNQILQPKLAIGAPNDAYEQEADRVAEQVMRMPDSQVLQRKCDACDDEEKMGALLQRKANGSFAGAEAPPIVHEVLRSPGQPLDRTTRAFMEPRFGVDFGHVRVHTDAKAAESARAVGALAYTVGKDVVFGASRRSDLIAHELSHVLQSDSGSLHRQLITPQAVGGGFGGLMDRDRGNTETQTPDQAQSASAVATTIVYICSKSLELSPIGNHSFFRIGSPNSGSPTRSLEPEDRGAECFQGQPEYDYTEDKYADASCVPTPISLSCLDSEFSAYPIGRYCTLGPNSNSFVGKISRNCGLSNPDPAGWCPGLDVAPPLPGTYAPSPNSTLLDCSYKNCEAVNDVPHDQLPA